MNYKKLEGTGMGNYEDVEFMKGDMRFSIRGLKSVIEAKKRHIADGDDRIEDFKKTTQEDQARTKKEIAELEGDIKAVEGEAKQHAKQTTEKTIDIPEEKTEAKK